MYPALLAIAVFCGAVAAFRRNPSYTTHSLLRSLPIILLAIATVVGLIIAAVHFTAGRSTTVMLGTIIPICFLGCFFLIYVTYTATTAKDAQLTRTLPPGASLVNIHRRKVYHWAKITAIILVACGLLRLILPAIPGFIALMFGAFVLFIAAILLPILYWTSRMMDVSLTALQADPWLHWVYSPEQWQQWTEAEVARLQATPPAFSLKHFWRKLVWIIVAIAGGVFLLSPGSWVFKTAYLAFILALFVIIGIGSARGEKSAPDRLRKKLAAAPHEVFFGRDGLYANGDLTLWRSTDTFLNGAEIDDRAPRSLLFRFERDVPNPYGPLTVVPIHQAVLIPPGHEADLALLQQHLTDRCPTASIALA